MMKDEVWQSVRKFYSTEQNIVWILDEDWNLKWARHHENSSDVGYVPQLLKISPSTWSNVKGETFWKNREFYYQLRCSQEDECRIVILEKKEHVYTFPEENESFAYGMTLIMDDIYDMNKMAQEKDLPEFRFPLNLMKAHCQRVNRIFYLRRMLEQLQHGKEEKKLIFLMRELEIIKEKINALFGKNAPTALGMKDPNENDLNENDLKQITIVEDERLFPAAVLSGLVLCCPDPRQQQEIKIIFQKKGNRGIIMIDVTELAEKRPDWKCQPDPESFSSRTPALDSGSSSSSVKASRHKNTMLQSRGLGLNSFVLGKDI